MMLHLGRAGLRRVPGSCCRPTAVAVARTHVPRGLSLSTAPGDLVDRPPPPPPPTGSNAALTMGGTQPPTPILTTRAQLAARTTARRELRSAQHVQSWHVFDARGYPVGRLASAVASVLRGKHKPVFENHVPRVGDFVVVINAGHIHFTGKKWDQKLYRWHSGYPSGLKTRTARQQQTRKPGDVLRRAIDGMLPRNKNRRYFMSRLRIYAGEKHPHECNLKSQSPIRSPLSHLRQMKFNVFSKPAFDDEKEFD